MTIIKMIIPFRDNIEKRSNIKVADILKNTSNNIKRNTDYINIIKESWDFKETEKKYKGSDILDISSNIHTAISGLSMLKDKYGD